MSEQNCVYSDLADAVIRGEQFNMYAITKVISGKYELDEAVIVSSIRAYDWHQAKMHATALVCSGFQSKPKANLSRLNKCFHRKSLYHPNSTTMYQQLKHVCEQKGIGRIRPIRFVRC